MQCMQARSALSVRQFISLLLFGFSSGLPLALSTTTLQAWFAVEHIDILTIGALTLVGLPYVWKFLWAPVLDRVYFSFLDQRRAWIASMQLCLAGVLLAMAFCSPQHQLGLLSGLALALAFFSATQDIAINAYQTEQLTDTNRGPGIALYVVGYRAAMVVSGGLALLIADRIGWRSLYCLMALLMGMMVLVTLLAEPTVPQRLLTSWRQAIFEPFQCFFQKQQAWAWIVFILLFKVGDAVVLGFSTPFLLNVLHLSLSEVGFLNKVVALLATLLGVTVGGWQLARLGLYRALLGFGLLQAVGNLGFAFLAQASVPLGVVGGVIFFEEFTAGMATAAVLALMMRLCDKEYSASQFALLSAVSAVARVAMGPVMGWGLHHIAWTSCFIWAFVLSLPALLLLIKMNHRLDAKRALLC